MGQEENIDRQIQHYLDGTLSEPELSVFESAMKSDPQLAAEVRSLRSIEHNLRGIGYHDLKASVTQWETEYQTRNRNLKRNTYFAVAASLAIFIIAGYFVFDANRLSPQDLYAAYYSPYPDMVLSRGEATPIEQQLTDGMQAYNRKDYAQAGDLLGEYLSENPDNAGAHLYLGIAQLETGSFDDAERNLELAAADTNYRQQAGWYLALLYLRTNQLEKVKASLQQFSADQSHYKRKDAADLLRKL